MTEIHAAPLGSSEERATVEVALDNSDHALDDVVEAAERAAGLGVPLQITVDHVPGTAHADPRRTHLMQRLDLAVELARSAAPGVEVRLPVDNPFDDPDDARPEPAPHQRGEGLPPRR